MYGNDAVAKRLKSRRSFLDEVEPQEPETYKRIAWNDRLCSLPDHVNMSMAAAELLPHGAEASWAEWKCLNRLRTGVGRSKVNLKKWGYLDSDNCLCECGTEETMAHLLRCPRLENTCGLEDLVEYNDSAKKCVQLWLKSGI